MEKFIKSKRTDNIKVDIKMPKFSYEWEGELKAALQTAGVNSIFNKSANPLGNMLNISSENQNIFVSEIRQSSKIIVDEEGTKAAAVTNAEVAVGSAIDNREIKHVYLNRPFGYLIVDNGCHDILFIGKVVNPSES